MSLNLSLEEGATDYNEQIPQPSPSNDGYYEMFVACQRPCSVVLERLSSEQVRFLTAPRPERAEKQLARNFLRDVPRVDFGLFAQYKRHRQRFIDKKNARMADIGDFGFSSGEDGPTDEEYIPESTPSSKKKRKRLAYEEDDDWNPDGRLSPRPKKTLRNLRVNTRRKRIESNSSSDEDLENMCEGEDVEAKGAPEAGFATSILDSDLLSKIMKEMEDFNQNSTNSFKSPQSKDPVSSFSEFTRSRQKRRISRVIKITDELTPSMQDVKQVVYNVVNTVCSFERQRVEEVTKRACKWCDVPFVPRSREELCKICKDVVKLSSMPKTSKRIPKSKGPKTGAKNKIKSKVLKNLPKYEQRRLMYGEKVSNPPKNLVSQQDVPDKNLTLVAAEVHSEPPLPLNATSPIKKKKLKNTSNLPSSKTKVIKTKKKKILNSVDVGDSTSLKSMPGKLNEENKSPTVGEKGLLRIDFPGAETSLGTLANPSTNTLNQAITSKQPASNNVQYGTYLLPPIPTVVVANYAATDAKSGDYYLSSVYYQNEMTQAKNVPSKNESNTAAIKNNSLPSMPSMDQLSISLLDQMTNIPSINFTQSNSLTSFPSVSTGCSFEAKADDSKFLANQLQVNNINEYKPYSLDHDISLLLNNPNLQIQPIEPRNSNVAMDSDIASLFSNSQLQIEPLIPSDDMQYNSMESDRPHAENNDGNVLASDIGNECPAADMPPKEIESSESAPCNPATSADTAAPKLLKKSKETTQSLKNKTISSNNNPSQEPLEEDVSSEALFRKMSTELDAIGILGVVDLDKNPRFSLERIMENNKIQFEQLQGMKPMTKEVEARLRQAEDNRTTIQLAKTLLNTFGCFTNLSNSCLRYAKILQIKQEKDLDLEETPRSSCQFARSATGQPPDHLASIETQITSIAPIDPAQYGTVHHFPAPRSESRETPSRGSGPLTPARPESAMSSTSAMAEEPALTPLQIKKERMEAPISPSQCSFATPSPARTPVAPHQPNNSFATPSSHQPNNTFQQSNPPSYNQATTSQDTFQFLNEMTQRLQNVGQSPQLLNNQQMRQVNIAPSNNQQMTSSIQQMASSNQQMVSSNQQMVSSNQQMVSNNQQITNINQQITNINQQMASSNQQMASSNQQMPSSNQLMPSSNQQMPNLMHFQQQGRPSGPPNVTAPFGNQNISKVLLNFAARRQAPQNNAPSANYIFKNGGQILNIQHQNTPSQNTLFKDSPMANVQHQSTANPPNVMFKNTQMVNVQQVYLPSTQPRFQGNVNQGQFNIVQQGQQVLVNSTGQQGEYSFQGQQMLGVQQLPRISNMNLQQNQVVQSPQNQAFMVQNNNRQTTVTSEEPMFCALCTKPATLRCKQCAKIAYCDTKCAKTYWHSRHKSECKPMVN